MKKGQIYTGIVERMEFPNRGIIYIEGEKAIVKNGLPGQEITFVVNKKRNGRCEGRVLNRLWKPQRTAALILACAGDV